ncbi:MAG TPA: hypothetical protein VMG10_13585 [Gemmataceae bacterium]|nr:hypothetical protein [Gemmataceae bacterium]
MLRIIFLTYRDDCWTTKRFEAASGLNELAVRPRFAFLMLAIEEVAEK